LHQILELANIMVFALDFVLNYGFEMQNEIQSMHWHTYQMSILVHICLNWNLTPYPHDEDSWILTKYDFYIFHDKKNDLNLFNIISNYIGNTWWTMDMHHNGTRCGMMHVHISLKITNHGILCRSIQTWPWATRCARFFWEWSRERS
jgi:hypothetical protein